MVRWEGGKGERMMRWQGGKGGRLMRWQDGKGGKVVRWQGGKGARVVRQEGGKYLVLFKGGERRGVQDFYFLFLMLIKAMKGQDGFNTF